MKGSDPIMQTRVNRILSVLLALVMVLSMLPAAVFAAGETGALAGWNVSLGDNIGVNFHLNSEDYTVTTTVNGAAVTPAISGKVVTVNVAAAQMTDTIGLTVKNGGEIVHTGEYSVRMYADTILNGSYDAEVKDMVKQMLNYGAAAQTYFNYNTDNLANSGITVENVAVPTEIPEVTVTDNLDGINLYGMSLVFQNKVAVRFYFDVTGNIANFTFSQGKPVQKDGRYYVEIPGINPQDLASDITLNVNGGALSVTYSPLTYIVRMYNGEKTSAALKSLVQAMYGYHQEAKAYSSIIWAGTMRAHASNGWNADALYFSMAENAAPIADAIRYKPAAASNIKLIRDGATYDVGHTARETIVKASETGYYIALWVLGDYKPLKANDILIVEGDFTNAANKTTLNISKSYVLINADGTAEFSTEMPTLPTTVEGGVMMKVEGYGWTGSTGDLIFKMDNTAPNGGYKPTSEGNIKLIRNGETYDVAYVGVEIFNKSNDGWYNIPFWTIVNYKPMLANDILVIEGDFYQESTKTTLNVSKTYVLLKDGGAAEFSTEMPSLSTIIDAGLMVELNGYGWNSKSAQEAGSMYFQMDANDAPDDAGYQPLDASCIKVIRDGETVNDAMVGQDVIYKANDSFYEVRFWTFANKKPLKAGDIIVFEGDFYNPANDTILRITKTYALLNADGTVSFSAEMPVPTTEVDCGVMSENAEGTPSEIYFTLAANSIPADEELAYPYAGTVQLVKSGNTSNVNANIYKLADDQYYLELDGAELTSGSYLIVEGAFTNADNGYTMVISKTYVLADGESLVYSETEPDLAIKGGMLKAYGENKWSSESASNAGNLWFALDNNDAATGAYRPTAEANVKLIRNGETYVVGHTARDTINKLNDTWYVFEFWTIADYKPMLANDILIVEGDFYQASTDTTLNITKTYILLNADGTATYSATEPVPAIQGGMLKAYGENKWSSESASNAGNLWFALDNNDAPTGAYRPTAEANVKLIRNGETYVVGHTARDTIAKESNGRYIFEFWTIADYKPMLANDILIVEGDFYQKSSDTTLNISKTYILLNANGTATYSDTEPVIGSEISHGMMKAYSENKWHSTDKDNAGNLWFALADNNAPNGAYRPTDAANVKLIRGGETYVVGHTARDTIQKINNGWYTFEFWTIDYKPMVAGDILIVEGDFYQASSDTTLSISKTYVTLNADGTATYTHKYVGNEADTEFGKVVLPTSSKNLKIGVWNGSYHVFTNERLAELKAAGITKIMGIDPQWTGAEHGGLKGMLDRAAAYNIDVIVDLRGWDGTANYAWTNTKGEPVCYLQDVVNHPALMGFIMYDEPSTSKFAELAELKAKFDTVMPADKLFFVNLYGSSAAASSLGITSYIQNYETHYVQRFLDELKVEVLSWDSYPLVGEDGMRTGYFQNFEIMASKKVPMWYTMLSSGHNTTTTYYETPTAKDLRWQMAVAMTYGVQNIDHYTYTSHEDDYSCMYDLDTGAVTDLYYDIKDVNNEYLAWDNIYMAYNWVGVAKHSANSNDAMLDKLSKCINIASYGVSKVESGENLLIGVFENNGNKAYMVTNAGSTTNTNVGDGKKYTANDTTVTLTLNAGDYKCAAIIDNGVISYVAVENNTVTFEVEAFEGVFVIPVLN